MISLVSKCIINPAIITELFDHKPISLKFSGPLINTRVTIKPEILTHSRIDYVITGAVLDTYMSHALPFNNAIDIDACKL